MKRRSLTVLALAGLLSSAPAAPAFAQKPSLDSRLEVRFEATPAADVFRHIISGLGLELQLDATVEGPVTIWVKDVSARTALNVVCESLGCEWRVSGNRLVVGKSGANVVRRDVTWRFLGIQTKDADGMKKIVAVDLKSHLARPLPVDMQFQDVPVSTILRALSEAAGLEITADEPVASKRVTLTASHKTVEDALKAVVDQAGGGSVILMRMKRSGTEPFAGVTIAIKSQVVKNKK